MKTAWHRRLLICLACLGTFTAAAADSDGCTGFKFDLTRELALFAGTAQSLAAANSATDAPSVQSDRLYALKLAAQADVHFASQPGKAAANEGSYAGILKFVPAHSGALRVTINNAAWLDLVANGTTIPSTDHTGKGSCKWLHKSVLFNVAKDQPVYVQISGSALPEVRLTLTRG